MGMSFNVTIAYAIEVPDDNVDYDEYATDGLEIISECEAGERRFLGKVLNYSDIHHCISSEIRTEILPKVKNRLKEIAFQYGLNEPKIWSIGAVS